MTSAFYPCHRHTIHIIMRKFIVLLLLLTASLGLRAALPDAFKGIYPPTDKKVMKSLNGTWHLKVIRGVNRDPRVPERDATWGTIPVPGCLEQYGFSKARYSLPDSLTGYYRTSFTVPAEWKGQRVCIRLDGVLRGYDLWLNGQQVGTWEMPYNTCLFDLTPYLTKKAFKGEEQQLALHVYSHYKGFEFDCFDDWAPMGIFRDVTLFTVPDTHLADMTVTTRNTGEVNVITRVANATKNTKVDYEVLDDQGRVVTTSPNQKIASPKLWTAETPYLYTLRVNVRDKKEILQTFTQKIGLRELTIADGKVLKLNGQPIKFRGVTCHATDPRTVKVIGDTLTLKDMKLMKAASINYIRTSHYPREPRFYELCDSLGFYVICEVPFGSRGAKHLSDTSYYSNLCARARATIYRHKNYPSVLIWSLGNENPFPKSCVRLGEYVKQLDTTRYICYPERGSTFRAYDFKNFPTVADIYAPHYPTTGQVSGFYQRSDRPVIFTEYLHTLGISFEDHDRQWEIIEKTPALAGGSVWEWVDQGMPFKAERSNPYGYEERVFTSPHGGFEMNGNQGTDGLLYADRTPLPNYYELQHNYAQAAITDTTFTGTLHVRNRYDFINLKDNVTFHWALTQDRDTVATGAFSPDCPPHETVAYPLSLPTPRPGTLALLQFDIQNRDGLTLLRQSLKLQDAPVTVSDTQLPLTSQVQQGPLVRVGRKVTLAENIKVKSTRIERYLQPLDNPYVKAEVTQKGKEVSYVLTPDTTRRFLSEVGVAYLLDKGIDRVQWIGRGPYPTYPGRKQAGRYGIWSMQKGDLYFEGNHMDVEACWLSDKDGRGVLITGHGLNVNFEQTDRGLVVTVNAVVAGEGPKFAVTAFPVWSNRIGTLKGTFQMQTTEAGTTPRPFANPDTLPAPFHPFYTQYDTYLMQYKDIIGAIPADHPKTSQSSK